MEGAFKKSLPLSSKVHIQAQGYLQHALFDFLSLIASGRSLEICFSKVNKKTDNIPATISFIKKCKNLHFCTKAPAWAYARRDNGLYKYKYTFAQISRNNSPPFYPWLRGFLWWEYKITYFGSQKFDCTVTCPIRLQSLKFPFWGPKSKNIP